MKKINLVDAKNEYLTSLDDYTAKSRKLSETSAKLEAIEFQYDHAMNDFINGKSSNIRDVHELFELYDEIIPQYDEVLEQLKIDKSYVKIAFIRFKKAKKLYEKLKKREDKKVKKQNADQQMGE